MNSLTVQLERAPDLLFAHLQLSLFSLLLGAAVSLPLGIWLTRNPRAESPVLGVVNVIQTIPALALLAFMVPVFGMLGVISEAWFGVETRAIGFAPALLALVLYSILPMLQNTVTGIRGVDPAQVEAARGVGMTDRQQLVQVELPQARPVIMAGVRTAAVWTTGMATLSTPIGAPSLGNYIFTGLQTRNFVAVTVGCVLAAALALVVDLFLRTWTAGIQEDRRWKIRFGQAGLGALAAVTLVGSSGALWGAGPPRVRVGSKAFSEGLIMANLFADLIENQTGLDTTLVSSLGSSVVFDAARRGDIDLYLDFSGTIYATAMKRTDVPNDPDQVLEAARAWLKSEHDLRVAAVLGYQNLYCLAMRGDDARRLGIDTMSGLIPHAPQFSLAADYEFFDRPEWAGVLDKYAYEFETLRTMESSLMYQTVATGDVDVISAYSTDGRIDAFDLKVLDDDRHAILPYHAFILVHGAFADAHPQVMAALARLEGAFDNGVVRALNKRVDLDGVSAQTVARDWLEAQPWFRP